MKVAWIVSQNRIVNTLKRYLYPRARIANICRDMAFTLAVHRSALPWKSFAVTPSLSQLQNAGVSLSKVVRSSNKLGLAYIFTGQGAQFAGMGRELLVYPVYKRTLQRAELYLHDMGCS